MTVGPILSSFYRQANVLLSALRTTNTVQEISGMDDGAASGL